MPDEFHTWLRDTVDGFWAAFAGLDRDIRLEFEMIQDRIGPMADRKTFAQAVVQSENKAFLFKLLDGAPIEDMIWKQLRPEYSRPFREQSEAVA